MKDKKWKPDRVLFIGTYAGRQYFDKLVSEKKYIQLAANQTEKYYIDELSNLQVPLSVLSCLVTNGAPKSDLFVKPDIEKEKNYIINNIGFLNIPYVSVASQSVGMKKEVLKLIKEQDFNNALIIVYSMRIPYLEAAKIIKKRYPSSRVINIVPDLPAFMYGGNDPIIRKILSGYNDFRLAKLREIVDGYVLYSRHMASYLKLRNGEWIVIEGIFDATANDKACDPDTKSKKTRFIYAGGIEENYGAKNLVEGFIMANLENAELLFYGSGSYSSQIEEINKTYPDVKYCGLVPPDNMKVIMRSATALINPRPADSEFTKYSCPSKVIEYMGTGIPVIMTRLEGIPEAYYRYVYTISKPGPEGVSEALISFCNTNEYERREMGIHAQKYICEEKNASRQIGRMIKFVEDL